MGTMTKADLIAATADRAGLTRADANRALAALVELIQDRTAAGDTVKIAGLGHFRIKDRPAREGRNPRTGEPVQIEAKRVLAFRPSKTAA